MSPGYDQDFVEWAHHSAELIRAGQLSLLDIEHIAEEVGDLAKRDRREARSRCSVILKHLAKWQMQPELRARSTWRSTLDTQRGALNDVLEDSPSLQRHLREQMQNLYVRALTSAFEETRLEKHSLPSQCPFTLDQILDSRYFPS